MIRHYESQLLLSPPQAAANSSGGAADASARDSNTPPPPAVLSDPITLLISLSHIASLIRKTLRTLQGEDPDVSPPPSSPVAEQEEGDEAGGSGSGEGRRDEKRSSSSSGRKGGRGGDVIDPAAVLGLDPTQGGYLSLISARPETGYGALETEIELERLRRENEDLRALLMVHDEHWRGSEQRSSSSPDAVPI
jgi:hypothetical protein